ncbi:amidohydrolase family protein [Desulfoferula mesophila]|uniref:Amidohydrolase n=1 Tax=Desulfoferula mesophila TaxID=3058419 RepID=A0AAU9EDR0_9BACT|nr:amidohydrolase [Desulfoferula mesophilus]
MTYPSTAYTARWVWCAPGDLRPGAAVTLQDGWITEVAARPPRGARVVDLGEGLLLPGLVNAHTHLELSGLAGLMPPQGDFVVWLESMVNLRPVQLRQNGPEATLAAVEYLAQSGTALVGDVTNTGKAAQALGSAGVSAVSFYEALGAAKAEPPEAQASWQGALLLASAVAAHAPYSIPTARLAALKAKAGAMPFAIHLAESRAEVEFLAGRGSEGRRLEEFLRDRGLRREDLDLAAATPLGQLQAADALDHRTLLVHGVQLTLDEIEQVAVAQASLCVCPRSNLGLTGGLAPVEALLAAGVNLALGTDSLASAPSLSLWEEMAALLAAKPGLDPEAVLTMATQGGARALGQAGRFGVLDPGAAGPLAFVPLAGVSQSEVIEAVVRGEHAGAPRGVGRDDGGKKKEEGR